MGHWIADMIAAMGYRVLGSALWTGLLVWAGYVLGANFESVQEFIDPVATVVLMIVTVIYVWRVIRHKGTSTGS